MSPRKKADPPPKPEHIHRLVAHCKSDSCPWVRCVVEGCGIYGTPDGSKVAYS